MVQHIARDSAHVRSTKEAMITTMILWHHSQGWKKPSF